MYKRSDWKQGADLPKTDRPLPQGERVILKTRKVKDSPAIKSRTKVKIRWDTDGSAKRLAANTGNLSRVFPVRIPNYKGLFVVSSAGIGFQYRDKRESILVAIWNRGTLRRSPQCPVELYGALQQSNIYLFHGSKSIPITWEDDCELEERQSDDPDAKIIRIKKTAPYKVAIGVAAHKQNMEDWRREARPAARLIKYDIRNGSRPLPAQRIARREAIAIIDQKEIDAIRAARNAATLKKKQ